MQDIQRVTPEDIKEKVVSGSTLLVCAYDSQEKFERNHLEGALSLDEFRQREPSLSKDQEIVFYCA